MDRDTFVKSIIDVDHADVTGADDLVSREMRDGGYSEKMISAMLRVARKGMSGNKQAYAECLFDIINKSYDEEKTLELLESCSKLFPM